MANPADGADAGVVRALGDDGLDEVAATGSTVPATNAGAKPPSPAAQSTPNVVCRSTVWPPHDVRRVSTVFSPHVGGDASGAVGPSLNVRCSAETGSSGLLSNVVSSRPVSLFARICPGSRIEIPRSSFSSTSAMRNISPDSGSEEFCERM